MSQSRKTISVYVHLGLGPCVAIAGDGQDDRDDCNESDRERYLASAESVHKVVCEAFRETAGAPDEMGAGPALGQVRGNKKFFFTYAWASEIGDFEQFRQEWKLLAGVIAVTEGAKDYWLDFLQCETEATRIFDQAVERLPGGAGGVDVAAAMELLNVAIAKGHLHARVTAAEVLRKGWLGKPDANAACAMVIPAAERGYLPAMYMLGSIATDSGKHDLAAYWFARASKHKDLAAMYRWGTALIFVATSWIGAPADQRNLEKESRTYRKSFELIQETAINGYPWGAAAVAISFLSGIGTVTDNARAYVWATKAIPDLPPENAEQSRSTAEKARSRMNEAELHAAEQMMQESEKNGLGVLAESAEARRQFGAAED